MPESKRNDVLSSSTLVPPSISSRSKSATTVASQPRRPLFSPTVPTLLNANEKKDSIISQANRHPGCGAVIVEKRAAGVVRPPRRRVARSSDLATLLDKSRKSRFVRDEDRVNRKKRKRPSEFRSCLALSWFGGERDCSGDRCSGRHCRASPNGHTRLGTHKSHEPSKRIGGPLSDSITP